MPLLDDFWGFCLIFGYFRAIFGKFFYLRIIEFHQNGLNLQAYAIFSKIYPAKPIQIDIWPTVSPGDDFWRFSLIFGYFWAISGLFFHQRIIESPKNVWKLQVHSILSQIEPSILHFGMFWLQQKRQITHRHFLILQKLVDFALEGSMSVLGGGFGLKLIFSQTAFLNIVSYTKIHLQNL